jgi:hypothetical protein
MKKKAYYWPKRRQTCHLGPFSSLPPSNPFSAVLLVLVAFFVAPQVVVGRRMWW